MYPINHFRTIELTKALSKDLDGRPAILHPLSFGIARTNDEEMICGFLHDVLVDSEFSAGELREDGFSEHIVDTLILLHHNLARGKAGGHLKQVKKHTESLELIRQLTGLDC